MAAQGATLQNYNNELVKCVDDLKEKREEVNKAILKDVRPLCFSVGSSSFAAARERGCRRMAAESEGEGEGAAAAAPGGQQPWEKSPRPFATRATLSQRGAARLRAKPRPARPHAPRTAAARWRWMPSARPRPGWGSLQPGSPMGNRVGAAG